MTRPCHASDDVPRLLAPTTTQPVPASRSAQARPIPADAPVMSTTLVMTASPFAENSRRRRRRRPGVGSVDDPGAHGIVVDEVAHHSGIDDDRVDQAGMVLKARGRSTLHRVSTIPGGDGTGPRRPPVIEDRQPSSSRPTGGRRRVSRVVTGITLTLVVAIAAEIALAATGTTPRAPSTPSQVLRASLRAAAAADSFHYRATWQTDGLSQTIVGDVGLMSGAQSVSVGGAHFTAVLVGQEVYFRGDAAALRDQLGLSARAASVGVGAWISLQQSDGPYSSIEQGLTTETALAQVLITPRATSPGHPWHGVRTLRVTGPIPPGTRHQVVTGSARLDVDPRSKLPFAYSARGRDGDRPWSASISFTGWGEEVPVTTPQSTVPYGYLHGLGSSPLSTGTGVAAG